MLLSCMQSKTPTILHVLAPHTAAHWSAVAVRSRPCHVIRAQARLESRDRASSPSSCAEGCYLRSDSLGLRIGRMHASSTCRRLIMASQAALDGRSGEAWWACSDEPGCLGQRHSILASEDGLPSRLVDVTPTANRRQLPLAPSLRAILPRCGAAIRPPPIGRIFYSRRLATWR